MEMQVILEKRYHWERQIARMLNKNHGSWEWHLFCSNGINWNASLLSWMGFIHSSSSPSEDHTSHHYITWSTPTQRPSREHMSLLLKSIFDSLPVVEPCRLVRRCWGLGKPPSPTFHALKRPARKTICDQKLNVKKSTYGKFPKSHESVYSIVSRGYATLMHVFMDVQKKISRGRHQTVTGMPRKQCKYCFLCIFLL